MKTIFPLLLILISIQCKLNKSTDTNATIKIVIDTEEPLPETETIYLTGNQTILGAWNPKALAMTRRSESRWEKSFDIDSAELEFKFTLGSFEKEAVSNKGIIPSNIVMYAPRDTELYFVIEDWKNPDAPIISSFGTIHSIAITPTNGLKPRKIDVLLPEGYDKDLSKRYPVIYLHDGQHQYDSTNTFNHQEWGIDETVKSLSQDPNFTTPICVAIHNTEDRNKEYGDLTKESKYHAFIINQLKQSIDSTFRTLSDRKNTATMGASMGGLVAFTLAWFQPDVFSKAACLSPAFNISVYDMVSVVKKYNGAKKDIMLYFDNGTIGLEEKLQPGLDEMKNVLISKSYSIEYHIANGAEHNEAAWAKRISKPLTMFFGK